MKRNHAIEKHKTFKTGAKRSEIEERFDLICPAAEKRVANRYAIGAIKYSDYNWCKGMPNSVILNHLQKHVNEYKRYGNKFDDNLAAIAWNAMALMHFEEGCEHHKAPWLEEKGHVKRRNRSSS